MSTPASLRLQYAGFRLEARSTEPAHLQWLDEFLSPWFTAVRDAPGDGADAIVALECSPERHARLLAAPPGRESRPLVDVFVLDSRVVTHPVWCEQDAERLILDEDLRVFYRVSRHHPDVEIIAGDGLVNTRVALMRVVRELAMAHAQRAGWLLHAAALEIGGRGIALLGPKRAGKTSLLLHLLRAPGARVVANDRVLVDPAGSAPHVTGLPSIVALRPGTLDLFPALQARTAERGYAFWRTIADSGTAASRRPATTSSDVSPAQLCDLLGVEAAVSAPLATLIFPQANPAHHDRGFTHDLNRLDPGTAERRLRDSLFGGADGGRRSTAFGTELARRGVDRMPVDAFCAALARAVPAFDYHLGARTMAESQSATALIDWLARAGAERPA